MQTLVLRIPDDLLAEIEAEARRLNVTKSEVARARLAGARSEDRDGRFDLIRDLVGAEKGGPPDISANKKRYLAAGGSGREKRRR
jgi:hypothetical protein